MEKSTRAAYNKEYHAANREKLNSARRQHTADNPKSLHDREKKNAESRQRYADDPERRNRPTRQSYSENPERFKIYHRKSRYGLTETAYQNLKIGQSNCCALCKDPFTKVPAIDHCHITGKVRGLLCAKCNIGLGLLGDSIESLFQAVEYLKKSL